MIKPISTYIKYRKHDLFVVVVVVVVKLVTHQKQMAHQYPNIDFKTKTKDCTFKVGQQTADPISLEHSQLNKTTYNVTFGYKC